MLPFPPDKVGKIEEWIYAAHESTYKRRIHTILSSLLSFNVAAYSILFHLHLRRSIVSVSLFAHYKLGAADAENQVDCAVSKKVKHPAEHPPPM
jgi:hypothetical protein